MLELSNNFIRTAFIYTLIELIIMQMNEQSITEIH